VLLNVIG